MRDARVLLDGTPVGMIVEDDDGIVSFSYDPAYETSADALPVSLTMPLGAGPFVSRSLHPFFVNLLPEGWLRELAIRRLRIDETDDFGLLTAMGADLVGAVEVLPT